MEQIIIKSIELKNYRQYLKQKIEFEYKVDKNISIVQGHNGYGKSNIFNAINWCFFGIEAHLESNNNEKEPLCNTKILNELGNGCEVETSVRITIQTKEGPKILQRRKIFKKMSSGEITESKPDFIVQQCNITNNWETSPYPEYVVSRILPKQMRNFFFIDGEKLRVLFENLKPQDVKDSIFDLSQINMLQKAIDHLNAYKVKTRKQIKDVPDLAKYSDRIQKANDEIMELQNECDKIKKQLEDAQSNKNKITSQIEEIGNQNINELEDERKKLEYNIDELQSVLGNLENEYMNYLFKIAPIVGCYEAINKSMEIISEAQKKGIYPPPRPHASVIDYILSKGDKCFCSAELNEERILALQKIKEQVDSQDILKDINTLQVLLGEYIKDYAGFDDKVKMYNHNINSLYGQKEELQKKLKEITIKLGNTDVEKVNYLHRERQKYDSQIKKSENDKNKLLSDIEYRTELVTEIDKIYNQQLSQMEKHKETNSKLNLCQESITALTIIKEQLMQEVRRETAQYTKEYFYNLVSAKDFDNTDILEDYQLVVTRDNFNCLYSLSAAETLCLGYSFMSALRKSSGFAAPIVIDTPLAKIASQYRANIAHWLTKSLGNAQVILLVTDTEYTKDFREKIYDSISQEFTIKHDKNRRISEVLKDE